MSNTTQPTGMMGLRHVALFVTELEACVKFYSEVIGMKLEWQPDADNYYFNFDGDNLALHRANPDKPSTGGQRLDHIGFILKTPEDVDKWYEHFVKQGVKILREVKSHRDGGRSFYCADPDGTSIEMIYHPPISDKSISDHRS